MVYDQYLASPEWAHKRALVFQRAHYTCEGCGVRPASAVHHLTYDHLGDEFLWELKAICHECHDRFHLKNPKR
jgi:5-methylcytosine-specific restriction endonuclease McrA